MKNKTEMKEGCGDKRDNESLRMDEGSDEWRVKDSADRRRPSREVPLLPKTNQTELISEKKELVSPSFVSFLADQKRANHEEIGPLEKVLQEDSSQGFRSPQACHGASEADVVVLAGRRCR